MTCCKIKINKQKINKIFFFYTELKGELSAMEVTFIHHIIGNCRWQQQFKARYWFMVECSFKNYSWMPQLILLIFCWRPVIWWCHLCLFHIQVLHLWWNVLNSSSMLFWYLSAGSFYLMFDIYHFTFAATYLINSFIQNKKITNIVDHSSDHIEYYLSTSQHSLLIILHHS